MAQKLINKKSSVLGRIASADTVDYGEIQVNFNASDTFLTTRRKDDTMAVFHDDRYADTKITNLSNHVDTLEAEHAADISQLTGIIEEDEEVTAAALTDLDARIKDIVSHGVASAQTAYSAVTSVSAITSVSAQTSEMAVEAMWLSASSSIMEGQVSGLVNRIEVTKVKNAFSADTAAALTGNITTGQVTNLAATIKATTVDSATTATSARTSYSAATSTSARTSYSANTSDYAVNAGTADIANKTGHILNVYENGSLLGSFNGSDHVSAKTTNTTYKLTGSNATVTLTPYTATTSGTAMSVTVNNVSKATSATTSVSATTSYSANTSDHATTAGSADVAGKISNITTSDTASSSADWRKVWITYADGVTGRPAVTSGLTFQTSTNTLNVAKLTPNSGTNTITVPTKTGTMALTSDLVDTKNTAGATNNTTDKLYLVGASAQTANPQTYSNAAVYATNGSLAATDVKVAEKVKLQYNSTNECLDFIFL